MARKYEMKRRAERQDDTRRRIIEAAIELHAAGNGSMSAIAARAGVGRMTVYRHFPDERELAIACTGAYFSARPMPDPAPWEAIPDAQNRLEHALGQLYGYYSDNEPMLTAAEVDAVTHPGLVEALAPQLELMARMHRILAHGWIDHDAVGPLDAAIGHALAFSTWRSLARDQGLTRTQAVELMVDLVSATVRRLGRRLPDAGPRVASVRPGSQRHT